MITTGEMFLKYKSLLAVEYDANEAEKISVLAFEFVKNYSRIDISLNKEHILDDLSLNKLEAILNQLLNGKPIQYITGYSWFHGMKFNVNNSVLIPRPETEELVSWVSGDLKLATSNNKTILDICTGSGCIAISLKKEFPEIDVMGIDISEAALEVARGNSEKNKLEVEFIRMDALEMKMKVIPDIVVSNPPYVLWKERNQMNRRVSDFEPATALFVPDNDPLIFYRKIASWSFNNLSRGGKIYFEINETMGDKVNELLANIGYNFIERKKDLQGKFRMFRAIK